MHKIFPIFIEYAPQMNSRCFFMFKMCHFQFFFKPTNSFWANLKCSSMRNFTQLNDNTQKNFGVNKAWLSKTIVQLTVTSRLTKFTQIKNYQIKSMGYKTKLFMVVFNFKLLKGSVISTVSHFHLSRYQLRNANR